MNAQENKAYKQVNFLGSFHEKIPLPKRKDKEALLAAFGQPFFYDNNINSRNQLTEYFFYVNQKNIFIYIVFQNNIVKTILRKI